MTDNYRMKTVALIVAVLALSSCASPGKKLNRVSLGMDKGQVLDIMGDPDSTKAADGVEVLVYDVDPWLHAEAWSYSGEYWVMFAGGRVVKYGKPQDVGTPVGSTLNVNITNQ
jgi:hypothetical protein